MNDNKQRILSLLKISLKEMSECKDLEDLSYVVTKDDAYPYPREYVYVKLKDKEDVGKIDVTMYSGLSMMMAVLRALA